MTVLQPEPPERGTPVSERRPLPIHDNAIDEGMQALDPNDPDVRKLALVNLALERGMPWKAIAMAIGAPDKRAAKKMRDQLVTRVRLKQAGVIAAPPRPGPQRTNGRQPGPTGR